MPFPTTRLVTAPAVEPISSTEAKTHLRVTHAEHDTYINSLITAARAYVELICNRALVTQTQKAFFPGFPCGPILLPFGKLQSVSTFQWTDADGTVSTWTPSGSDLLSGSTVMAHVDIDREPGAITLAYGQSWPSATLKTVNPIEIQFVCGYGLAAAVPLPIKQAMLLLIGHWYRNAEAVVVSDRASVESRTLPFGVDSLIVNYRLHYV